MCRQFEFALGCGGSPACQHIDELAPPGPVACSDNPRAREALRQCLPDLLRNPQFTACLKDDLTTRRWLAQVRCRPPLGSSWASFAVATPTRPPRAPVGIGRPHSATRPPPPPVQLLVNVGHLADAAALATDVVGPTPPVQTPA